MGIRHFWPTIAATGEHCSLYNYSMKQGFETNHRGHGMLILGIDMSITVSAIQAGTYKHRYDPRLPTNPVIAAVFKRLTTLLQYPVIVVCVFDGPERPAHKRGKTVACTPFKIVTQLQRLINALGFYYVMAPAEAEAELAYLNRKGLIDVILTEDSDSWVFGAKAIIRREPRAKDMDKVVLFLSERLGISQAGILLVALLAGADYDKGLPRCGIATAIALAQTRLATSLHGAALTLSEQQLDQFLIEWRKELCYELASNAHSSLRRIEPIAAGNVTSHFLSAKLVRMYTHPRVIDVNVQEWVPRLPDLQALARFADKQFSWGEDLVLAQRFRCDVWPGYFSRQMMQKAINPAMSLSVFDSRWRVIRLSMQKGLKMGLVEALIRPMATTTLQDIQAQYPPQHGLSDGLLTVAIPIAILKAAFPSQLNDYLGRHKFDQYSVSQPDQQVNATTGSQPPVDVLEISSDDSDRLDVLDISSDSDDETDLVTRNNLVGHECIYVVSDSDDNGSIVELVKP